MRSLSIFLFCVVLTVSHAAISYNDQPQVPGKEGQCYDKDGITFYSKGDIMKIEGEECSQRKCLGFLEELGKVRVETLTCPTVEAGVGCTIVQDPSKPYPDCCPKVVSIPSKERVFCNPNKQTDK